MKNVIKAAVAAVVLAGAASAQTQWNVDVLGAHRAGPALMLGGAVYIPAKDIASDPDAAKEVPAPYLQRAKFDFDSRNYINEARDILTLNAQSDPYADVYRAMLARYSDGVTVTVPTQGNDFNYCLEHPGTLAFTPIGQSHIYMCARSLTDLDDGQAAQAVVHEMAHVLGYADECEATKFEITAMRKAGRSYFISWYVKKCGLI